MSLDSTAETVPAPPPRGDLPPLRIHHFLVWTTVMAVSFAVHGWTNLSESSATLWAVTIAIVQFILISAALTCLLYGTVWWWRDLRFPSEPGHALVILVGISTILSTLMVVLISGFDAEPYEFANAYQGFRGSIPYWTAWLSRWNGLIIAVLVLLLSIAFAVWLVSGVRWRLVFALIATVTAAGVAVHSLHFLLMQYTSRNKVEETVLWLNLSTDAIPTAILMICIVLAVMEDRRLAISRHWSHWVGVGVYVMDGAFKLVRYAVWYLVLGGT
jgi:hypothetical protein